MLWLWIREDGERPKVIEGGRRPSGPGFVFEIDARSAEDARAVYLTSLSTTLPDADPHAWAQAELARRRVRRVDLAKEVGGV